MVIIMYVSAARQAFAANVHSLFSFSAEHGVLHDAVYASLVSPHMLSVVS